MIDSPELMSGTAECGRPDCGVDPMCDTPDATTTGGFTILVAEDDMAIRTLTGDVLLSQGYNVLQAADGVEALEVAAQYTGPIHLLLTDVSMPRLDGCGLHGRISNEHPETTTLFMSGDVHPGPYPQAPFLPKPFTVLALLQKVKEALTVRTGSAEPERAQLRNPLSPNDEAIWGRPNEVKGVAGDQR